MTSSGLTEATVLGGDMRGILMALKASRELEARRARLMFMATQAGGDDLEKYLAESNDSIARATKPPEPPEAVAKVQAAMQGFRGRN